MTWCEYVPRIPWVKYIYIYLCVVQWHRKKATEEKRVDSYWHAKIQMFANNITYTLETTTDRNGRFCIHSSARFELVLLVRSFVHSFILSIIIVPEYVCSICSAYMICYSFCLALIMPSLGILLLSSLCLFSSPKSWTRHRARILGAFNLATTV